ncbi:hypothetical protein [Nocardia sp. alder85J]|uniref:hypothetical protein n=1 Tax=Nocardia sp. alder85J TaxID=2862949 RepID=UPI001CD8146E|nr:hypothetical protein [Nocardia sp. alder85J]MCX4099122.1 hypothetical protein [Nocardia sp. alder85J]
MNDDIRHCIDRAADAGITLTRADITRETDPNSEFLGGLVIDGMPAAEWIDAMTSE